MRDQASFSDAWSAPLNRPPPYNGVQLASFERLLQCCAKAARSRFSSGKLQDLSQPHQTGRDHGW
jgi:hypothetical protein